MKEERKEDKEQSIGEGKNIKSERKKYGKRKTKQDNRQEKEKE